MSDDPLFTDFLRRVRAGDEAAAEDLVRRYESAIRVAVRVRLTDPDLRRQFDSVDVCQSVLASFFLRAAAGQYDLQEPAQLVGLLVRMALNKLVSHVRRSRRQRRDLRRDADASGAAAAVFEPSPGPERQAEVRDLLAVFRAGLSDEERTLVDHRAAGRSWEEIAAELGGTAQARRKQLGRAVERMAPRLGLVNDSEVDDV
jgi:RNA polymerase sigma-70 factor (ECF subfamily)